jgi:hypothetical protein
MSKNNQDRGFENAAAESEARFRQAGKRVRRRPRGP